MRLSSLGLSSVLAAGLVSGCILVIEDDDPEPGQSAPDAGTVPSVDAGGPAILPIVRGCRPGPTVPASNPVIQGDFVSVDLTYGGGCRDHALRICWDGAVLDSEPPQVNLVVRDDTEDPCEALIHERITIDLSLLRGDPSRHDRIWLNFSSGSVLYEF
jgi:hypothetical protein